MRPASLFPRPWPVSVARAFARRLASSDILGRAVSCGEGPTAQVVAKTEELAGKFKFADF